MSDWRKDQERFGSRSFDQDRWRDEEERSYRSRSNWDRPRNAGREDDFNAPYRGRQDMGWSDQRDDWSTSDSARFRDRDDRRSHDTRSDYGRPGFGGDYGRHDWRSSGEYGRRSGDDWRGGFGERFSRGSGMGPGMGSGMRSGMGSSNYGRGDWRRDARSDDERSFWDRATDEVSSWFGDRDAEQRRNIDEARSHRGRGPKGYARSDERIREDVSDRLSDDPSVDASDIEVVVAQCEVTLTGTVDSRDAKRRAEDCAEGVSGVKHVQNNLRVQNQNASWSAQSAAGQGFGAPTQTTATTTGAASGSSANPRQRV